MTPTTGSRAAKPNVYGWMLARHFAQTVLKVPRLRVRVTIQIWRPWTDARACEWPECGARPETVCDDCPNALHATPAKGDLASRIDAQLPKRQTPKSDLHVEAADG